MAMPDPPSEPRVLVAVDASAASLLALELAADLAAALRASLTGLYVEEEDLLHAAGLPFARRVRAQSGELTPFSASELEREWRALAGAAREALTRVAQARRLSWQFEVVRGRALQVVSEASRGVRLAGLGVSSRGERRLGSLAQAALGTAGASLLLVPPQRRPGTHWVALIDSAATAPAVLGMVTALVDSGAAEQPLLLVKTDLDASLLLPPALATLPRLGLPADSRPQTLAARLRTAQARGLILGADSPLATPTAAESLLADGWPLLLVR